MIAVAAILGMTLAGAPAARAGDAPIEIGIEDNYFKPASVSTTVGANHFVWIWDLDGSGGGTTANAHTVTSADGLFGSELMDSGTYELSASAGSFKYFCVLHADMVGTLRVAPTGVVALGTARRTALPAAERRSISLRWAPGDARTGDRFDVRFRVGKRPWSKWKEDTKRLRGTFGRHRRPVRVKPDRKYSFKARSQRGGGEGRRSGWSPVLKLQT
jgi:plastocyanin